MINIRVEAVECIIGILPSVDLRQLRSLRGLFLEQSNTNSVDQLIVVGSLRLAALAA